jgi:hypothetical protein
MHHPFDIKLFEAVCLAQLQIPIIGVRRHADGVITRGGSGPGKKGVLKW